MAQINIEIYRGCTFNFTLDFEGKNLTGCTFKSQLRDKANIDSLQAEFQIEQITSSKIQLKLSINQTNAIQAASCVWDLLITYPDGSRPAPLFEGFAEIKSPASVYA